MTVEFRLPDVGEGLHEAEVVAWLVTEGERVDRNQPLVELMTDKSSVEMPSPAAGVVRRLGAAAGDIVAVGEVLIVIDDEPAAGSATGAPSLDPTDASSPGSRTDFRTDAAPSSIERGPAVSPVGAAPGGRRPKASPSTRRLAARSGVDLSAVAGTGPGGRILASDVETAARRTTPVDADARFRSTHPTVAPERTSTGPAPIGSGLGQMAVGLHPLRGIRRATAKAMDRSWSTIPHISASREVDATALLSTRSQLRSLARAEGLPITPLALVLVAVARALRRFPMVNATLDLDAETIAVHPDVNIGIAVATEVGLYVPVIHDADRLDVFAMAAEVARLSAAARGGTVTSADLAGGTHTVTNYGSAGGHLAAPIIRPGEAAITGLGAIDDRPIVVDGDVVARPTLPVVVCADHRLIDGDVMSAFHHDICRSVAEPIGLLLEP